MEAGILVTLILPLALFMIMLGMGLSLTLTDFKRVLESPKAATIGILCQMILLPLVCIGIISIFNPPPVLAVGLFVLSLCPGGTISNMISYLAKADLALSVTLTAIVSLITPFTIPIFTKLAISSYMGADETLAFPIGTTILKLMVITVIPIGLGMILNKFFPRFALMCEKPVKIFSTGFLFLIIAGILSTNSEKLVGFFAQIGPAAMALNVVTMLAGFFIARRFKLTHREGITIGIEVGIQNGTTALLVTGTILANSEMSIAPAIYSLLMFVTVGIFAFTVNKIYGGQETGEAPAS